MKTRKKIFRFSFLERVDVNYFFFISFIVGIFISILTMYIIKDYNDVWMPAYLSWNLFGAVITWYHYIPKAKKIRDEKQTR